MTEKFTLTGGARIGTVNASYPFAELYVDREILKINASIVGNLMFQPKDIISIKPYTIIPLLGQGIKINHSVENYNSKVIFWTFKAPEYVIGEIEKTGFLQNRNRENSVSHFEIIKQQREGGFPIKKAAAIFFVLTWNILFLADIIPFFLKAEPEGVPIGIGMNLAVGLVFITSILAIVSEKVRALILKENRNFEDIKKFVYLIALVSGIIVVGFTIGNLNN